MVLSFAGTSARTACAHCEKRLAKLVDALRLNGLLAEWPSHQRRLTARRTARKTGLQAQKESFAPDVCAQDQTEIKLSELRPCRIALGGQDMPTVCLVGATSAAFEPARIGGPSPAGLECHAASTANRFAAADLTLMRSLRSSEKSAGVPRSSTESVLCGR